MPTLTLEGTNKTIDPATLRKLSLNQNLTSKSLLANSSANDESFKSQTSRNSQKSGLVLKSSSEIVIPALMSSRAAAQ